MMNNRFFHCVASFTALLAVPANGEDALLVPEVAQSVQVRMGDDVVRLSEAIRRATADERLAAYRQLRESHGASAAGQLELARWCHKQGLKEEERLHWRIVRFMQPAHAEAAKALGLQNFQGAWLTKAEIAELKEQNRLVKKAERQWTAKLKRIRQSIERGNSAERKVALREFDAIRDPLAMPVVEKMLAGGDTEIGLRIVEMFARLGKPQSTEGLVRLAVRSPDPVVRKKAAGELRYQRMEDYVPLLLAGLQAPIELSSLVTVDEGGPEYEWYSSEVFTGRVIPGMYGVIHLCGNYTNRDVLFWTLETKRVEGWRVTHVRPDRIQYRYVLSRDSPDPDAPYEYTGIIEAESGGGEEALHKTIAALKQRIGEANAQAAELNKRIDAALMEATDADVANDRLVVNAAGAEIHPRVWWDWWKKNLNLNNYFSEGTEIWTQAGLLPIEQVLVGDRVLTRNPKSKELSFNLVIGVDRKRQDAVQVVEVNSRSIVATAEQPLFVIDQGWRRADGLKPGMKLFGLGGPQRIENVVSGLGAMTYSLLVDATPNLFVDRSGILVHDATRP
jgi:hypothetical protein